MSNQTTGSALLIRRIFNAPRERVFAQFVDPALVRAWFGPPGTVVTEATIDPKLGGRYRIAMTSSSGETFVVGGAFTDFRAPERLAYTFRWEEDEPELERDTTVSIDFIDLGGRTEIVFAQDNFADDASRDRHDAGWSGSLAQLSALLEARHPFTIRGMDLSGYMCKDAPRAIAFYRDLLGLEPSSIYPDDRGAEFDLPDGTTFGLWGGGGKVMPFQPSNGILFAVDDLALAVAALGARGIAVTYQTETPACFLAMFGDSEGNTVTVHQRKSR